MVVLCASLWVGFLYCEVGLFEANAKLMSRVKAVGRVVVMKTAAAVGCIKGERW